MEKQIKEIFKELKDKIPGREKTENSITAEINTIMGSSKENKLSEEEYEKIRDNMFSVANYAEECGFVLGFQYAVRLLMESMVED